MASFRDPGSCSSRRAPRSVRPSLHCAGVMMFLAGCLILFACLCQLLAAVQSIGSFGSHGQSIRCVVRKEDASGIPDEIFTVPSDTLYQRTMRVRSRKANEWMTSNNLLQSLLASLFALHPVEKLLHRIFKEQERQDWRSTNPELRPLIKLASVQKSPAIEAASLRSVVCLLFVWRD